MSDAGVRQYPERTEEAAVASTSGDSEAERKRSDRSVTLAAAYQAATVLKDFCQQTNITVDTCRIEEALEEFSQRLIKQTDFTAFMGYRKVSFPYYCMVDILSLDCLFKYEG